MVNKFTMMFSNMAAILQSEQFLAVLLLCADLHFIILDTHNLSPRVTDHSFLLLPSGSSGSHGLLLFLQQGVRDGEHRVGLQLKRKIRYKSISAVNWHAKAKPVNCLPISIS